MYARSASKGFWESFFLACQEEGEECQNCSKEIAGEMSGEIHDYSGLALLLQEREPHADLEAPLTQSKLGDDFDTVLANDGDAVKSFAREFGGSLSRLDHEQSCLHLTDQVRN